MDPNVYWMAQADPVMQQQQFQYSSMHPLQQQIAPFAPHPLQMQMQHEQHYTPAHTSHFPVFNQAPVIRHQPPFAFGLGKAAPALNHATASHGHPRPSPPRSSILPLRNRGKQQANTGKAAKGKKPPPSLPPPACELCPAGSLGCEYVPEQDHLPLEEPKKSVGAAKKARDKQKEAMRVAMVTVQGENGKPDADRDAVMEEMEVEKDLEDGELQQEALNVVDLPFSNASASASTVPVSDDVEMSEVEHALPLEDGEVLEPGKKIVDRSPSEEAVEHQLKAPSPSTASTALPAQPGQPPKKRRKIGKEFWARRHTIFPPKPTYKVEGRVNLANLPEDVLFEIFQYLYPEALVALTFCCKSIYHVISTAGDKGLWLPARERYLPCLAASSTLEKTGPVLGPMPGPEIGKGKWTTAQTELRWALWMFGGGNCEFCGNWTGTPPACFALNIRVCLMQECRSHWRKQCKQTLLPLNSKTNPFRDEMVPHGNPDPNDPRWSLSHHTQEAAAETSKPDDREHWPAGDNEQFQEAEALVSTAPVHAFILSHPDWHAALLRIPEDEQPAWLLSRLTGASNSAEVTLNSTSQRLAVIKALQLLIETRLKKAKKLHFEEFLGEVESMKWPDERLKELVKAGMPFVESGPSLKRELDTVGTSIYLRRKYRWRDLKQAVFEWNLAASTGDLLSLIAEWEAKAGMLEETMIAAQMLARWRDARKGRVDYIKQRNDHYLRGQAEKLGIKWHDASNAPTLVAARKMSEADYVPINDETWGVTERRRRDEAAEAKERAEAERAIAAVAKGEREAAGVDAPRTAPAWYGEMDGGAETATIFELPNTDATVTSANVVVNDDTAAEAAPAVVASGPINVLTLAAGGVNAAPKEREPVLIGVRLPSDDYVATMLARGREIAMAAASTDTGEAVEFAPAADTPMDVETVAALASSTVEQQPAEERAKLVLEKVKEEAGLLNERRIRRVCEGTMAEHREVRRLFHTWCKNSTRELGAEVIPPFRVFEKLATTQLVQGPKSTVRSWQKYKGHITMDLLLWELKVRAALSKKLLHEIDTRGKGKAVDHSMPLESATTLFRCNSCDARAAKVVDEAIDQAIATRKTTKTAKKETYRTPSMPEYRDPMTWTEIIEHGCEEEWKVSKFQQDIPGMRLARRACMVVGVDPTDTFDERGTIMESGKARLVALGKAWGCSQCNAQLSWTELYTHSMHHIWKAHHAGNVKTTNTPLKPGDVFPDGICNSLHGHRHQDRDEQFGQNIIAATVMEVPPQPAMHVHFAEPNFCVGMINGTVETRDEARLMCAICAKANAHKMPANKFNGKIFGMDGLRDHLKQKHLRDVIHDSDVLVVKAKSPLPTHRQTKKARAAVNQPANDAKRAAEMKKTIEAKKAAEMKRFKATGGVKRTGW